MLKSQARRRITTKAAAAGVLSAGVAFGALPALGALVGPSPVTYKCTPTSSGTPASFNFQVQLNGPVTTPTPNGTVSLTWVISQPNSAPFLTATAAIVPSSGIVIDGDLVASGPPVGTTPTTLKPTTNHTLLTTVPAGEPVPLPTMTATLVPTAAGTFTVKPGDFHLKIGTSGASYSCSLAATASPSTATPLPLTVVVASPSASKPSSTPPTSPTPTKSKTTHTVFKTVTKKPKSPSEQVTKKPGGGADTGGGGDAGPDGRTFVMVGTLLVLGAGAGGLMMRHRRPRRG